MGEMGTLKNALCYFEQILKEAPSKKQLYGHLPPLSETIQLRRARHVEECERNKEEHISNILLWTPTQLRSGLEPVHTMLLL